MDAKAPFQPGQRVWFIPQVIGDGRVREVVVDECKHRHFPALTLDRGTQLPASSAWFIFACNGDSQIDYCVFADQVDALRAYQARLIAHLADVTSNINRMVRERKESE